MEAIAADPKETVLALGREGKLWSEIAQQTGVNGSTVRVWLHRAGIVKPGIVTSVTTTTQRKDKPNEDHSSIVRNRLGRALVKATEALERIPVPRNSLAMRNLANLVKDVAEPAKSVFAWSESATHSSVDIRLLQSAQGTPIQAIDVPAQVVSAPIEPSLPAVDVPGTVASRD